jgi:hypothetical protein
MSNVALKETKLAAARGATAVKGPTGSHRVSVGALGATGPAQIASAAVSGAVVGFAFGGPAASVAGAAIGGLLGVGVAIKDGPR